MRFVRPAGPIAAVLILALSACTDVVGLDDEEQDAGCVTRSIQIGQAVPASLSAFDCVDEEFGTYVDWFELVITATVTVDIVMESLEVDSYLEFYDEFDQFITDDDDSAGNGNAWITVKLSPGVYYIAATSFDADEQGSYILSVE